MAAFERVSACDGGLNQLIEFTHTFTLLASNCATISPCSVACGYYPRSQRALPAVCALRITETTNGIAKANTYPAAAKVGSFEISTASGTGR
jgi:hypothetical protein|eukprot:COSAG02_NODE_2847_length_7905_cov_3.444017_4_plen_92_part_00